MPIKNEHIIWAYGDMLDGGGQIVIAGLTPQGLDYLRDNPGKTLVINPPMDFPNVKIIIIFHEKSKEALKQRLREAGVNVTEVN